MQALLRNPLADPYVFGPIRVAHPGRRLVAHPVYWCVGVLVDMCRLRWRDGVAALLFILAYRDFRGAVVLRAVRPCCY